MRSRILALVTITTALVVLAFAIPLAILTRDAVVQRAERSATDQARSITQLLHTDPGSSVITAYLKQITQTDDHRVAVVLAGGTLLGQLPPDNATVQPLPTDTDRAGGPGGYGRPQGGTGQTGGPDGDQPQLQNVPGGKVAVAVVDSPTGLEQVIVYVSSSGLDSGVGGWWLLIAGASAALIILGAIGGELVTRRIVRPLTQTAQTAHRITAGDVTARAPTTGPREVAEVGEALNRLADRIDELIADERETVADLSHRLRTPLTALRLEAETLRDPVEAERIGGHVNALERMLTAVIRAARRPQREGRLPSADATAVVGDRVTFWSALTDEQGRERTIALPSEPVWVRASAEDLGAAVDALLENVIAHTPEGTAFEVALAATATGARIDVVDHGDGFGDDEVIRGRSDRGSTGLGLDIARRCARASGGDLQIGNADAGGARVTLILGAP